MDQGKGQCNVAHVIFICHMCDIDVGGVCYRTFGYGVYHVTNQRNTLHFVIRQNTMQRQWPDKWLEGNIHSQKTKGRHVSATNIELVGRCELQLLTQCIRRSGTHPVEDVIVALLVVLRTDSWFLQQVMRDEPAAHLVLYTNKRHSCSCCNIYLWKNRRSLGQLPQIF